MEDLRGELKREQAAHGRTRADAGRRERKVEEIMLSPRDAVDAKRLSNELKDSRQYAARLAGQLQVSH